MSSRGSRAVSSVRPPWLEPTTHSNLINLLAGELVAVDPQAWQVFGKPHLKRRNLQFHTWLVQQRPSISGVLGLNQRFQQVALRASQSFSQNETVLTRKSTRVVETGKESSHRYW